MINLKINGKKVQWNIVAGIFLLIFAFFIIFTSNDNKASDNVETTSSNKTEVITITSAPEETTTKDITEETTTQQNAEDLINFDEEYPFLIRVNRAENFAVVYGMNKNGRHTIPYKAFVCSTGLEDEDTPLGVFEISDKYSD